MTVIASASPSASVIVVEVVGATNSGPTSGQCGRTSAAAEASASIEPGLPVIATIGIADMLEMVDHRLELGGLAALRDQDRGVALGRHSEIAVDRLGQVKEGRGRAGRGEGRGDLAPDMTRFAKSADDQLAVAAEDQPHGLFERPVEAVGERVERARLVVQDLAPELQDAVSCCRHASAPWPSAPPL